MHIVVNIKQVEDNTYKQLLCEIFFCDVEIEVSMLFDWFFFSLLLWE